MRRRALCADHPLVGKRIVVGDSVVTVTHVNDGICWGRPDGYPGLWRAVLQTVAEEKPEVVARSSFDYRPGDRG